MDQKTDAPLDVEVSKPAKPVKKATKAAKKKKTTKAKKTKAGSGGSSKYLAIRSRRRCAFHARSSIRTQGSPAPKKRAPSSSASDSMAHSGSKSARP